MNKDDQQDKKKKIDEFKRVSTAHFQEYVKRVGDYLKKTFMDMDKIKLVLSPVVFRVFKEEI